MEEKLFEDAGTNVLNSGTGIDAANDANADFCVRADFPNLRTNNKVAPEEIDVDVKNLEDNDCDSPSVAATVQITTMAELGLISHPREGRLSDFGLTW